MKSIWKYKLAPYGTIEMPLGAKILSAGVQNGAIFIWAEIDPNEPRTTTRRFATPGTGHSFDAGAPLSFINTVFVDDMVFHIYEVIG